MKNFLIVKIIIEVIITFIGVAGLFYISGFNPLDIWFWVYTLVAVVGAGQLIIDWNRLEKLIKSEYHETRRKTN